MPRTTGMRWSSASPQLTSLRPMKLLVTAPTTSRMASASSTPRPGTRKPIRRSGCQRSGRISSVWSSVPTIHCSTHSVMPSGARTRRPANSQRRSAAMVRVRSGAGARAATPARVRGRRVGLGGRGAFGRLALGGLLGRLRVRGLGFVRLRGVGLGGGGARAAAAVAEIGDVPAGSLELEAGGGDLLAERRGAASGARGQRRVGDLLQDILGMATGAALVGVDRHGVEGRWGRYKAFNYRRRAEAQGRAASGPARPRRSGREVVHPRFLA